MNQECILREFLMQSGLKKNNQMCLLDYYLFQASEI